MLSSFRKFSSSLFAKIFLVIVAIPFVFWGMGDLFSTGSQKIIVRIDNEKVSTQEFINYLNNKVYENEKINKNNIDKYLYNFIGEKLILNEIEDYDIKLSDDSLGKLIKNQTIFKKENKFSRIEYEKFLITNNTSAVQFESLFANQTKKNKFLNFVKSGLLLPNFLVNQSYAKINQKRNIEIIDLDKILINKKNYSEKEIEKYFNDNKDKFKDIYKNINFKKLNSKNLTGNNEFSDLFFKKIDEIDDMIVDGKNLDFILKQNNLGSAVELTIDKNGKQKDTNELIKLPKNVIKKIFDNPNNNNVLLIENKDEYIIIEIKKNEVIQKTASDPAIKENILSHLQKITKRKYISNLISKINNKNFSKLEFDNLSKKENAPIKKIELKNLNDSSFLIIELVNQIYKYPEKSIVIASSIDFSQNYLVYINKIENVKIKKDDEDYEKYFNIAKQDMETNILQTYDAYINKKYEIEINNIALKEIKNYFQ